MVARRGWCVARKSYRWCRGWCVVLVARKSYRWWRDRTGRVAGDGWRVTVGG